MFTKRLYFENAYIKEFDARVLSCEEGKERTDMKSFWMKPLFFRKAEDSPQIRGIWRMGK